MRWIWIVALGCVPQDGELPPLPDATTPVATDDATALPCGGCPEGDTCVDGVCVRDLDDDTAEDALPIEIGVPTSQVIWPDGDQDWYHLDVPGLTFVELTASNTGGDNDFDAMFGWFVDGDTPLVDEVRAPESQLLGLPGPTFLRVRDEGDGGDEDFDYTLEVKPFPGTVLEESTPAEIEIVDEEDHFIAVPFEKIGDSDQLAVVVTEPRMLRATVWDELSSPGQAYLKWSNPAGIDLTTSYPGNSLLALAIEPGTYTLTVHDQNKLGEYVILLVTSFEPGISETEPNDDWDAATETVFDDQLLHLYGTFDEPGDEEWFVFPDYLAWLEIGCGVAGRIVVPAFELYAADGELLLTAEDGGSHVVPGAPRDGTRLRVTGDGSGPGAWWRCGLNLDDGVDDD